MIKVAVGLVKARFRTTEQQTQAVLPGCHAFHGADSFAETL